MSGGVDSAVAALLVAGEGGEAVGVTLELWADAENDGDQSCCSAQAVRQRARAGARPRDVRISRSTCARSFARAWSITGSPTTPPGRRPTPASAATATCASTRCSSSPAAGLARRSPRATTRACQDGPLLRVAADESKDQSYVLSALCARVARAHALPARRSAQGARARAGPGGGARRSRAGATPRICAFSRAPHRQRLPAATWRDGRPPGRDRRRRRNGARRASRRAPVHGRPAPRARARGRRCCVCAAPQTRARTP